jgi:hypothetical protein
VGVGGKEEEGEIGRGDGKKARGRKRIVSRK